MAKDKKAAEDNGGGGYYLDITIKIISFLAGFSVTMLILDFFNLI